MSVVEFSKLRKGDRLVHQHTGEDAEVLYVGAITFRVRYASGREAQLRDSLTVLFAGSDEAAKRDAQR